MRYHFARDIGGIIQLSIIFAYWTYGTLIPLKIILLPYYHMGFVKWHAVLMFGFLSIMTISSLIRSSFFHPGSLPNLDESQADWEYCDKCCRHRPPRAHHCRRCGHCVARMDHHCPWINNCVGEDNHFAFMQLIFYSLGLSVSALTFCFVKSYRLPPCPEAVCVPESFFTRHEHTLLMIMYVLAVMMSFGMTALSCGQHFGIAMDVTTLEAMISSNPMETFFSKPDRPMRYRYEQLCGTKWLCLWFLPCRKRYSLTPITYSSYSNIV